MKIKEKDLEIILDRCKATVNMIGLQKIGFLYTDEQFLEALNRILTTLGEREIEITPPQS